MKKISIIIPVYNKVEELRITIASILNQTLPIADLEIIVADDGSSEDIKAVTEEYTNHVLIKYLWQKDDGFRPGAARNMGIYAAEGEVSVFLDCGVILTTNCLEEHYRLYQQYGEKLVVLGYIYGCDTYSDLEEIRVIIDGHTPDEAADIMEENKMLDGRDCEGCYWQVLGDDLTKWPAPWVALWGGHFSASTRFLHDNNICFDEHFKTWGCEDNELGIQRENAGCIFVVGRKARAIHYPAKERSYDILHTNKTFRNNYKNNRQYIAKKYPNNKTVQIWAAQGDHAANVPQIVR